MTTITINNDDLLLTAEDILTLDHIQWKMRQQALRAQWPDREDGTLIALCHSELSEALEGFRKDLMDDHLPNRKMAEVELADCMIRIFDLAGKHNFDLAGAIAEKHRYNMTRADHKPENRAKEGGKKW